MALMSVACNSGPKNTRIPSNQPDGGADQEDSGGQLDQGGSLNVTETPLTVVVALTIRRDDGGTSGGNTDGGPGDAGTGADASTGPTATLTITARDGQTPVITDLWLYEMDGDQMSPLTGFTATASRRSPRLMLPATVGGRPSGLVPADDGRQNGIMTNTSRATLSQGALIPTISGTVVVTLPSVPTSPILVLASLEDQRYAGAAVINPDGTPGTVPAGVGSVQTHLRRSFERDVAPILRANCSPCHNPSGPFNTRVFLVTGARDELVNDNLGFSEAKIRCETANPSGGPTLAACIQGITQAQFLVEPGAPAVSVLLQRARPDEEGGTSALGLPWYGNRGVRYNATSGDRRMPSTTTNPDAGAWTNAPTHFDMYPEEYQMIFDWVAQGAQP